MGSKEIYRDDSEVRQNWRRVLITYEVNGDEFHTEVCVVVAGPIVSIVIEEMQ